MINANQTNGIDINELEKILNNIQDSYVSHFNQQEEEALRDSIDLIRTECKKSNPRKSAIRSAFRDLNRITKTINFMATVVTLTTFMANYLH